MNWHVDQSDHNADTNAHIRTRNPHHRDWEITTNFYSALHLINGYFLSTGHKPPRTHKTRGDLVRKKLPQIFDEYDQLHWLSIKARYRIRHTNLTRTEEEISIVNLSTIRDFITNKLGKMSDSRP